MYPQSHENPVRELPVLKLWIKLVAGPCHRDVAVEFHKHVRQITMTDWIGLEHLVHDVGLVLEQEEKDELDKISSDVLVRYDVLIRQDEAC